MPGVRHSSRVEAGSPLRVEEVSISGTEMCNWEGTAGLALVLSAALATHHSSVAFIDRGALWFGEQGISQAQPNVCVLGAGWE